MAAFPVYLYPLVFRLACLCVYLLANLSRVFLHARCLLTNRRDLETPRFVYPSFVWKTLRRERVCICDVWRVCTSVSSASFHVWIYGEMFAIWVILFLTRRGGYVMGIFISLSESFIAKCLLYSVHILFVSFHMRISGEIFPIRVIFLFTVVLYGIIVDM